MLNESLTFLVQYSCVASENSDLRKNCFSLNDYNAVMTKKVQQVFQQKPEQWIDFLFKILMTLTENLIDVCSLWLFCKNTTLHFEIGWSDLKDVVPSKERFKKTFQTKSWWSFTARTYLLFTQQIIIMSKFKKNFQILMHCHGQGVLFHLGIFWKSKYIWFCFKNA